MSCARIKNDNIFYKPAIISGKILIALILLFFTSGLFCIRNKRELYFGIFFLVFITLPTIFIVYCGKKFMEKLPNLAERWEILEIIYAGIVILFIAVAIIGLFRLHGIVK